MDPIAVFLRAHEVWAAPIIEWGGLLLYLAIILSPFLIIRHRLFRPTRWWHIVGAYMGSFTAFLGLWYSFDRIDQWAIHNLFTSWGLSGAYGNAILYATLWLVVIYPALTFYSTKLLYGRFTEKRFWLTSAAAAFLFGMIVVVGLYVMVVLVGQALTTYL